MEIFTITTIQYPVEKTNRKGGTYKHRDMRCVGYAADMETAKQWVVDNVMDINEAGYYPLAVVEKRSEGIYAFPDEDLCWFEWNEDSEKYDEIECPDEYERVFGFGIG